MAIHPKGKIVSLEVRHLRYASALVSQRTVSTLHSPGICCRISNFLRDRLNMPFYKVIKSWSRNIFDAIFDLRE